MCSEQISPVTNCSEHAGGPEMIGNDDVHNKLKMLNRLDIMQNLELNRIERR
jgi:hypothetical protein